MPHLLLPRALRAFVTWPTTSQAHARRNALVANTELAQRRAEREDVERFLGELAIGSGGSGRIAPWPRRAQS